jgi:dTDP-4-amino-4,6-dideoxygalactose transaminase
VAIKGLELRGEVITTPFSYVATTSSLVWEGCTPVFADIDPERLTISPEAIVRKITTNTSAILATHVFGHPCDVERIEEIAKAYKLKVIYDAAHAFGVVYKDRSLVSYGDCGTLSFHATKIFHTAEGGAIVSNSAELHEKMQRLRNFGHVSPTSFREAGINGKMSELHAAMGLCMLPLVDEIVDKRKIVTQNYDNLLGRTSLVLVSPVSVDRFNYAYYPVLFPSETALQSVMQALNAENIFPRRYFYPSLNTLPYVAYDHCPVSEDISGRILCLPIYPELTAAEINVICEIMIKTL